MYKHDVQCMKILGIPHERTCIRKLFVTATGGSGTTHTSHVLRERFGVSIAFQTIDGAGQHAQNEMSMGWFNRADVLSMMSPYSTAHRAMPTYNKAPSYSLGRGKCLFEHVLVQVRHPLKTIASLLAFINGMDVCTHIPIHFDTAEQSLLYSRTSAIMPHEFPNIRLLHNSSLANRVIYVAHHWWAWNTAALDVADDFYLLENMQNDEDYLQLCRTYGLRCSKKSNTSLESISNYSHGGSEHAVSWELLKSADPWVYRKVRKLAIELGYND